MTLPVDNNILPLLVSEGLDMLLDSDESQRTVRMQFSYLHKRTMKLLQISKCFDYQKNILVQIKLNFLIVKRRKHKS